jgi:hypothetical protein
MRNSLDPLNRLLHRWARGYVVTVGIDADLLERIGLGPGQRIEFKDRLQLVAKERKAPGAIFQVGGPHLQAVAAHAEAATLEGLVVATVLLGHEFRHHLADVIALPHHQVLRHRRISLDRADAIDAGHRRHDDHVIAFQKRPCGRMAHPVDLFVDLGFLLDIGIRPGNIGFGLVVVVVGYEVFDRIVGEEALEFAVQLRGQRLVRGKDDGGALGFLDHLGHGEGLAGARGPQQHLVALARQHTFGQFGNRGGLVARRLELGLQHEATPAFQLGAGQHLGAQDGGVDIVVGHVLIPSRTPNLIRFCSQTTPDSGNETPARGFRPLASRPHFPQ